MNGRSMNWLRHPALTLALMLVASATPALAVTPPDRINYQGVLRDAADAPLDGDFDMVFHLWSAKTAGDEVLLDRHLAANAQAVTVTGGLFSVPIGTGQVLDGAGPGTYTTLADVFRDYRNVWIEVQIGSETLSPRVVISSAAYAFNASSLDGRPASGFLDTGTGIQTKRGKLIIDANAWTYGIDVKGRNGGGLFADSNESGYAWIAAGNDGIKAQGSSSGGFFLDSDSSGSGYVGRGDFGVEGFGDTSGGYFLDTDSSGYAYLGHGDHGISGYGDVAGGYFKAHNGNGEAFVGLPNEGIQAQGNSAGGHFLDLDNSGEAYLGFGDFGMSGYGNAAGGYFLDLDSSGEAYLGYGNNGISAQGDSAGGYFLDLDNGGYAYVGYGTYGIQGFGDAMGGYFVDSNESGWARVGYSTYKIQGNGTVSFIQNHPADSSRVIVYHAPESSEVAVYARGSARLQAGRAVVAIDPTFAWTANPDLGLTAQVTARGSACALYVESVSTQTLVVAPVDPACADAAFDYMVWGLRIGFEQLTPVQEKNSEAYIPSMASHRERIAAEPQMASYTALERFKTMQALISPQAAGGQVDLSRAHALVAAIHEFDPATDSISPTEGPPPPPGPPAVPASPTGAPGSAPSVPRTGPAASATADSSAIAERGARVSGTGAAAVRVGDVAVATPGTTSAEDADTADASPAPPPSATWLPVSGPVEAGDLLTLDPERPGILRRASSLADPGVVGVAAGTTRPAASGQGTEVAVLGSGFATVKVDAGYGAIRSGDLLVSSPTPGHAMRTMELVPGTILGKAIEPFDTGSGTIRVLLMPR